MRSLLCLHGSGGSASEWNALGAWAAGAKWQLDAIDAPAGTGKWWTYPAGQRSFTASSYSGAEESIALVERELVRGKYDGLLGFSQGAMLAAIVAARSALGEGPPIKCAVMCSAAVPKPYEALLHRLRDAPAVGQDGTGRVLLPTLHCLCKQDPMNPAALGEEVAGCFAPSAEVLWHGDGHAVPSPGKGGLEDVAAWLDRAVPLPGDM
jgi:pimeloyl-ACP methyl ester carboxylesterase